MQPQGGTRGRSDDPESKFFFDHSADLLCVVGPDGRLKRVNAAWERLLNWTSTEFCDAPLANFVHPDDKHAIKAVVEKVQSGTATDSLVTRLRGKDGTYRRLQWRFGMPSRDGSIPAVACDMTGSHRPSDRLDAAERASGFGTWEIDPRTRAVGWSENACRICGLDPLQSPTDIETSLSGFRAEARTTLADAIERLIAAGTCFDLELPFVTGSGKHIWLRLTGSAELRNDGPARIFGTLRDVTCERNRRSRLERLGMVAQRTTNTVILVDRDMRIEWVNPAFERQTGYRLSEVAGLRPSDVLHGPDTSPETRKAIFDSLGAGRSVRTEILKYRKDRSTYWVDINIEPVRDGDGRVDGFIAVETDVSAARENTARLESLERSAREARDRLIHAVEALPDAFVLFDADDRLVLCNQRYREFYAATAPVLVPGTSFEEIERYALAHGQLPDAFEREEAWLHERLDGRVRGDTTIEQNLPDGRTLRTVERRTATGELVAFHSDITELRSREQEAIAARNALQATLDAIPDLLFEIDPDGRIIEARHGTSSKLNRMPEEYPGLDMTDIMPEDAATALRRFIKRTLEGEPEPPPHVEIHAGKRWYEVTIAKKPGNDRHPRFLLAARDIDARKLAEAERAQKEAELAAANADLKKALRERDAAETRFFDIASVSHDWFWEQDADLRFTFLSESLRQLDGMSPESHLGKTREELSPEATEGQVGADLRALRSIMESREPFRDFVYRHPAVAGKHVWVRISGGPVFAPDGTFQGYRGVGSDVTALYEARLRAEEANAAKSRFLANMSHEIRTPLNGIMGMAAVLEEIIVTPEEREMLRVIGESGAALVTILNDILDFSKIEAGLMELDVGEFSPASLARRVASLHRLKAEEKGLEFTVTPGADSDRLRCGDGHRILQILHNLVGNAIKFTSKGSVSVTFDCTQADLRIDVRDTGIGLHKDQLARVFAEFVQADSSITRKYGGAGLGLSITRRLVQLMNGKITMDSNPGLGTVVRVRLPLPFAERHAPREAEPAAIVPSAAGVRALVADDNATNRLLMGKFLEKLGVGARIVSCGRDAVEAAAEEDFDLLLLDISMPDMTGIEVLASVRAADAATGRSRKPAIAVTANAMHHQVVEYLQAGFDGHVSKPIRPADLMAGINAALALRKDAPTVMGSVSGTGR